MAKTIRNMNDLSKALEPRIRQILDLVAEDVKKDIDEALDRYYDDYNPVSYLRTDQLKNCCKISKISKNGTAFDIEIYLDIDSLQYTTKGADAYKTVKSGDAGLHGGWNPSNISAGQIPWEDIADNNGTRYGSGTQIWEEPMRELFDNGKLIELFKKYARLRGLNIK